MQSFKIIWLEGALDDIENVRSYYKNKASLETAEQVLQRIVRSVSALKEHPNLGRASAKSKNLRELIIPNSFYIVPYRIKKYEIELLRIYDTRQKPLKSWL